MRRRTYIASLPAVALAGCLERGRLDGVESPDTPEPPERIASEWPAPAHDPGRTSFTPETDGPTTRVSELWSVSVDAPLSGPVLADETLYVGGDDGVVRALDARTGAERWQASVGAPAGTPRVVGDTLYVPTTGAVVALGAPDGTTEWRVDAPDREGFLVADHGMYYVSGGEEPSVVARDRVAGSGRWRADVDDPWTATLFAGEDHVFVSTGPHGSRPWGFDRETGEYHGTRRPEAGHDLAGEQFVLDGTVFAADAFFGTVRADAVTDDDYDRRWGTSVDANGGFALAGGSDHVFFGAKAGDESGLYALSLSDGKEAWYTDAVTGVVGRPVVASDAVLVLTDAELRCFDPADGSERWSYPGDEVGRQFVLADDLVFTTQDGTVRALRAA